MRCKPIGMRICKYCNKPIAEEDIWNPDNDGNGYHHECLIDMEFKSRDRQIYNKGKMDMLDKIIEDIQTLRGCSCWRSDGIIDDVEDIIDKYKRESEV